MKLNYRNIQSALGQATRCLFLPCVLLLLLVSGATAETAGRDISLINSGWLFQPGEVPDAEKTDFKTTGWQKVTLPHCWGWEQVQKGDDYYRGPGWYRRELSLKAEPGKRYYVRFGAAGSVADVYLNGRLLGEHRGAFGAFCYEVTTNLSATGANVLALRVSNARADDLAPLSGDFPVYGGLYRSVQLIVTGGESFALTDHASAGVAWLQARVSPDEAVLDVTSQISNGTKRKQPLVLVARVLDADGKEVAATNSRIESVAGMTAPYWQQVTVTNPHLWNGRIDPYLYRAVVELRSTNGAVLDSVEQPLGLRFYSVDPDKGFFLNGKPYPIHGVCRHQDHANKGWAISTEDSDQDVALMKEMGVTAVRCSHYEQSGYFYSLCDRAGILVWAEIPQVNGVKDTAAFEETSRNQLLDLIRQNVNHPAIFAWSLFNEIGNGATEDPHRELQDLNIVAHGEDPTRPTIAATSTDKFPQMNKIPTLLGWNRYPGWYSGTATPESIGTVFDQARYTSRSGGFCVSEYGAGANPQQHEDNPKQPKTTGQWHPEEWQSVVHEAEWAAIKSHPFVWGSFLWNMFDFCSPIRHEGGTVGLNDKGLVTADRKIKKDAFYFYKANWSDEPVLYITSRRFTERTNAVTNVKIYSNAASVELLVNGKSCGTATSEGDSVFVWKEVQLSPGENQIEARAERDGHKLKDSCDWKLVRLPIKN